VPIVRHHHENWDGTGYPDGIAGEAIPLGARILSVVDCFDALTSDRPYRPRMTDAQALAIVRERRGVMYDPAIVDVFVAEYTRIMPAYNATPHPASRVIGDARAVERLHAADTAAPPDASVGDGLLAVTSLSRAIGGDASVGDVGTLLWTILKQVLPSEAMAIFMPDETGQMLSAQYATGLQVSRLRTIRARMGAGVVGWVAATRRVSVNADPVIDAGYRTADGALGLGSCLAVPLVESGSLVAVLALYRTAGNAFSDDDGRLLELLGARVCAPLAATSTADIPAIHPAGLTLLRRSAGV
jgi:GAF domain-containing protein